MLTPLCGQTLDTNALSNFSPSIQRDVYDICSKVKLDAAKQTALARAIEKENERFADILRENEGVMTTKGKAEMANMRDTTISTILNKDEQEQYYRGLYDVESEKEGTALADAYQKKYNLTDQNWKFIRVAWYKYLLESHVIKKMMASEPKKAQKKISERRAYWLDTIEKKGGIRINPDDMSLTVTRPFNPDTLHK